MEKLYEYSTFIDYGIDGKIPTGYKKIRTHLVFAVKQVDTKPEWLLMDISRMFHWTVFTQA